MDWNMYPYLRENGLPFFVKYKIKDGSILTDLIWAFTPSHARSIFYDECCGGLCGESIISIREASFSYIVEYKNANGEICNEIVNAISKQDAKRIFCEKHNVKLCQIVSIKSKE